MKKIGIYNPYLSTLGGGEKYTSVLAEVLSQKYEVEIITHHFIEKKEIEATFDVDLSNVKIFYIKKSYLIDFMTDPNRRLGKIRAILNHIILKKTLLSRNLDCFINFYYLSSFPSFGKKGIYICMFPQQLNPFSKIIKKNTLRDVYEKSIWLIDKYILNKNNFIETYDKIIAISKYSQVWIKKYWKVDTDILYPPCDNVNFNLGKKKNVILSVGRFFVSSHNKKHDIMIDAFKQLKLKNIELHLVGMAKNNQETKSYIRYLKSKIGREKIYIHVNARAYEVRNLYEKAKVYWHAAGYGESEEKDPEKMEHFGISTVEAMSAGAIPVVIKKGGQIELFRDNKEGFYWSTLDELVEQTRKIFISNDFSKISKIALNAKKRSVIYGRENFKKNVNKHITSIIE